MNNFIREPVKQSKAMLCLTEEFEKQLIIRAADKHIEVRRLHVNQLPPEFRMSFALTNYHVPFLMNRIGQRDKQICILYNDGTQAHWVDVVHTF